MHALLLTLVLAADGGMAGHHHAMPSAPTSALDAVAQIHGEAGAWAVLGWRMGEHALKALGIPRGSFELEVEHQSPKEVRYACITDGVQASTGASLGRLQLSWKEAPAEGTVTVFRSKKSKAEIRLKPTAAFVKKYFDVPREQARAKGQEVLDAKESELFELAPAKKER